VPLSSLLSPAAPARRWWFQFNGDIEWSDAGLGQQPHDVSLDARSFIEVPMYDTRRNNHE
jgi:hypothetical protein